MPSMMQTKASSGSKAGCGMPRAGPPVARSRMALASASRTDCASTSGRSDVELSRRALFAGAASVPVLAGIAAVAPAAIAVQGITAGRLPGLSTAADAGGFFTYTRPEGKSGGHGIGWSEVPRYSFKVPAGWEEIPVSIADLGGAEIDLRFQSREQGDIAVVVAPVLRFMDAGFNANIRIQDIGPPDKIIAGFGPELFGRPVDETDVMSTEVVVNKETGLMYYFWQVKPHSYVAATAVRNRIFILTLASTARQARKYSDQLAVIWKSFDVPLEVVKQVGPQVSSQGV